jgi:PAS domain S-box-containing protein
LECGIFEKKDTKMGALKATELVEVLRVDKDKCVNCHACISACPVKFCNDGSGDYVTVNKNLCIACGNCIDACTHTARTYVDDFDLFIQNISKGHQVICLLTPSVSANFPERYLHVNGWLRSLGVKAVFDVSFGAELTIKSYLNHIQTNKPELVIAQPCPAIVTYIQLYQPDLIKYLAPVDSPILHTIKMIKEFYADYSDFEIAIISPCTAKKREFEETGLGTYNIGFKSVDRYLQDNHIDLSSFEPLDFDNPPAERAVLFSTPGGLLQTIERTNPEFRFKTRKIEGVHSIYPYLDKLKAVLEKGMAPALIDCLNCENGCNAGPLTLVRKKSPDEIEYWVARRNLEMRKFYDSQADGDISTSTKKIDETLKKFWKQDIYKRHYLNLWANVNLKYPNEKELWAIYNRMHKYSDSELYNCTSCGYGSCEKMATAIFNDLNRPENCHFYLSTQNKLSTEELKNEKHHLDQILETALDGFVEIDTHGRIVSANPSMRNIVKKNDLIGRFLNEFLDDDNQSVLHEQVKLREHNVHSSYELDFTQSDGNKISCMLSGSPLFDRDKNRIGSFAIVSDISALKKSQAELKSLNEDLEIRVEHRTVELKETVEELNTLVEELQQQREEIVAQTEAIEESQQRLNDLVEFMPDAILVIDKEGIVSIWNHSMEMLTGIPKEEMIGKGDFEYAIPFFGERRPLLINLVQLESSQYEQDYVNLRRGDDSITGELYAPVLNGGHYLMGNAALLFDCYGEVDGAIEIIRDITPQKRAEIAVQMANSKLEKQQLEIIQKSLDLSEKLEELSVTNEIIRDINSELDKLSLVARETNNSIAILTPEGNFEWINLSFEKMYGYCLSDLIENFRGSLFEAPFTSKVKINFQTCIAKQEMLTFESFANSRYGDHRWMQTTLTPLFSEENEVNRIMMVETDISALKEAHFEIMQKKEEIETQRDELQHQKDEMQNQRDQIARKNKQISDSILYAKRIQKAVIPSQEIFDKILPENFIFFRPRDVVSGDFYWIRKKDDRIYLCVADCTGHGVPGAFMSMLGLTYLNELINSSLKELCACEVLDLLRVNIVASLHQKGMIGEAHDGMDIAFCIIDYAHNTIEYSGANNPLFLIRQNCQDQITQIKYSKSSKKDSEACVPVRQTLTEDNLLLVELKADKMPIGTYLRENSSFSSIEINFQPGDTIYLFSDGYAGQFGGDKNQKFLLKNFKQMLLDNQKFSMDEQRLIIKNRFNEWKGDHDQVDDILVIGVKL